MKFRIPEVLFGSLLAVAIFAMGMLFASSYNPGPSGNSHGQQAETAAQNSHGGKAAAVDDAKSSQNHKQQEGNSEFWTAKLTDWLLAIFTALLVAFTYRLWKSTDKLWLAGEKQIVAAQMSAEAAQDQIKLSRRALVQTQRAFVHLKHFNVFHVYDTTQNNKIIAWRFTAVWQNSGPTPTEKLNVITGIHPGELPAGFEFKIDKLAPSLLGPQSEMTGESYTISLRDIFEIKAGIKTIYIWGRAEYNDVFPDTQRHCTNFCHKIVVTGDPTIVESGIAMIAADVGNYTDDDYEE